MGVRFYEIIIPWRFVLFGVSYSLYVVFLCVLCLLLHVSCVCAFRVPWCFMFLGLTCFLVFSVFRASCLLVCRGFRMWCFFVLCVYCFVCLVSSRVVFIGVSGFLFLFMVCCVSRCVVIIGVSCLLMFSVLVCRASWRAEFLGVSCLYVLRDKNTAS